MDYVAASIPNAQENNRVSEMQEGREGEEAQARCQPRMWFTAHLFLLHGHLQVIVYPGDDLAIEARQGKQGGGRGRGNK